MFLVLQNIAEGLVVMDMVSWGWLDSSDESRRVDGVTAEDKKTVSRWDGDIQSYKKHLKKEASSLEQSSND